MKAIIFDLGGELQEVGLFETEAEIHETISLMQDMLPPGDHGLIQVVPVQSTAVDLIRAAWKYGKGED